VGRKRGQLLFRHLFKKVSEWQKEVQKNEWHTCLTNLSKVYSGLFGRALIRYLCNLLKGTFKPSHISPLFFPFRFFITFTYDFLKSLLMPKNTSALYSGLFGYRLLFGIYAIF
jgi:hypothetical protein